MQKLKLTEIAKAVRKSNIHGTSFPFYEVQRQEYEYCREEEATHFCLSYQGEGFYFELGDVAAVEEHMKDYYDDSEDSELVEHVLNALNDNEFGENFGDIGQGFEIVPLKMEWKNFSKFFFSEASAEAYTKAQYHNHGEMRVVAQSAFDLDEVRTVRAYFLGLGFMAKTRCIFAKIRRFLRVNL